MNSTPDPEVNYKQDALHLIVTKLETTPRHQWRKEATRLANMFEQQGADALHKTLGNVISAVKKNFMEGLTGALLASSTNCQERMAMAKALLQERLQEYPFLPAVLTLHEELSLQEEKKFESILRARFHRHEQELVSTIQKMFKTVYKASWVPQNAREEFIEAIMRMQHGGEVKTPLQKFLGALGGMASRIDSSMKKIVDSCYEMLKEVAAEDHANAIHKNEHSPL